MKDNIKCLNKTVIIKKIIFSLVILLMAFFLFYKNIKAEETSQVRSNTNYYKKTERILEYESNEIESFYFKYLFSRSFKYYLKVLTDPEKEIYQKIVDQMLTVDIKEVKDSIVIVIPSSVSLDVEKIARFFLYDNPGLFYINDVTVSNDGTNYKIVFNFYIQFNNKVYESIKELYKKTEMIKEDIITLPILKDRCYRAFQLLTSYFKKSSDAAIKDDKSNLYNVINGTNASYNAYISYISYILNILDCRSVLLRSIDMSNLYLIVSLQNKEFLLDIKGYLQSKEEKYIHRYFLQPFKNKDNIVAGSMLTSLSHKSFDETFKYRDGYVSYTGNKNNYRNRVLLGDNPNPNEKKWTNKGLLSDAPYDEYKAPIDIFQVPSKPDFTYNYFYLDLKTNLSSKKLPEAEGEYIYYLHSEGDVYLEAHIRFNIKKRYTVIFKNDLGVNIPSIDVLVYHGDYVFVPRKPEIDGYVFNGYSNSDVITKPIMGDKIITESFRKPIIQFYDEDKKENTSLSTTSLTKLDSDTILKEVKPAVPEGYIFVGYKIMFEDKITEDFIGKNLGDKPIITDIKLVVILHKIDLDIKGYAFRYNKKVKDKINTFRVHPKNKIPDLTKVKFGRNDITANGIKFSQSYEKLKTLDEFDITFTACSLHSYDEREIKAHIIVDHNMFLTVGWLKKNWWLVVLVILLIIFSPFLIKLLFKIIKLIRKIIKSHNSEKRQRKLEEEILEQQKQKEKLDYLESVKQKNANELYKENMNYNQNNYLNENGYFSNDTKQYQENYDSNNYQNNDYFNNFQDTDYDNNYQDNQNYNQQNNSNSLYNNNSHQDYNNQKDIDYQKNNRLFNDYFHDNDNYQTNDNSLDDNNDDNYNISYSPFDDK